MAKLTAVEYTDTELLALYRQAAADLSVAQMTVLRGKTVTRANLDQIRKMIGWLEDRISRAAAGPGSRVVYGTHGRK